MAEAPNPYTPPLADSRHSAGVRVPGEWVKHIYGMLALAHTLMIFARFFGAWLRLGATTILAPGLAVQDPVSAILMVLGLVWIYCAWKGIPPDKNRETSPAGAVIEMFVPLLNLFWLFEVNTLLCDTLDRILAGASDGGGSRGRRAPKTLAVVAAVLFLLAFVLRASRFARLAPLVMGADQGLWLLYMIRCDVVRREVVELGPRA